MPTSSGMSRGERNSCQILFAFDPANFRWSCLRKEELQRFLVPGHYMSGF